VRTVGCSRRAPTWFAQTTTSPAAARNVAHLLSDPIRHTAKWRASANGVNNWRRKGHGYVNQRDSPASREFDETFELVPLRTCVQDVKRCQQRQSGN
jgi:hypothetical protein